MRPDGKLRSPEPGDGVAIPVPQVTLTCEACGFQAVVDHAEPDVDLVHGPESSHALVWPGGSYLVETRT